MLFRSAYVLKQSAPTEFLRAVRAVAAGGIYLDPSMTAQVASGLLAPKPNADVEEGGKVTERESQVLRLVAVGHSNVEIAEKLLISVKTVEAHKANAMKKLGLNGRIDIVKYAALQGWLPNT